MLRMIAFLFLAVIITLPDGSAYSVTATQVNATTWAYRVEKVSGKDLSHWVLSLGICDEAVVSTEPPSTYGADPTTGVTGYKFEPIASQSATYTIALVGEYSAGIITATMKAGALGNYASMQVAGPDCSDAPQATVTPTATATETETATATSTATATNTATPTDTATPTSTTVGDVPQVPTVDPATLTPQATPTVTPTETPTVTPTITPTATDAPTNLGDDAEPAQWWQWMPWIGR